MRQGQVDDEPAAAHRDVEDRADHVLLDHPGAVETGRITQEIQDRLGLTAKPWIQGNRKTVVLFFEKGAPTRKIWYYQLDPGRNLGKTNPLNDDDLKEFVELQATFADSDQSWSVAIEDILS